MNNSIITVSLKVKDIDREDIPSLDEPRTLLAGSNPAAKHKHRLVSGLGGRRVGVRVHTRTQDTR